MMICQNNNQFSGEDEDMGFGLSVNHDPQNSSIFLSKTLQSVNIMETIQDSFQIIDNQVFMILPESFYRSISENDPLTSTDQNQQQEEKQDKPIKNVCPRAKKNFQIKKRAYCRALAYYIADKQPIFGLSRRFCRSKKNQKGKGSELSAISEGMSHHSSSKKAKHDAAKRFDQELNDIYIEQNENHLKPMDKTQSVLHTLIYRSGDDSQSKAALDYYINKYNERIGQARFLDKLIKSRKIDKMSPNSQ